MEIPVGLAALPGVAVHLVPAPPVHIDPDPCHDKPACNGWPASLGLLEMECEQ